MTLISGIYVVIMMFNKPGLLEHPVERKPVFVDAVLCALQSKLGVFVLFRPRGLRSRMRHYHYVSRVSRQAPQGLDGRSAKY